MSEPFWLTLTVGGDLTNDTDQELLDLIEEQGPETEPEIDEETGHLTVQIPDVNYANLETVEAFCRKNHLSFNKWVDGKAGFDSIIAYWRPGMEYPGACTANNDGQPVIRISDVWEALVTAPDHSAITDLLEKTEPPDLPRYRIVD